MAKNTALEANIPENDILFGFCDFVDKTLEFMNTGDDSTRMLGTLCKKDPIAELVEVGDAKNRVICFSQDSQHLRQCQILKNYFGQFLLIKNPKKEDDWSAEIENFLQPNKLVEEVNIRVTVVIFCHGGENYICGIEFDKFYKKYFAKIRSLANQVLILDKSCYSGDHMEDYEGKVSLYSEKPIDVEIYIHSSCKNTCSVRNADVVDVILDLMIGRISFPHVILDLTYQQTQKFDSEQFVRAVLYSDYFWSLENIFPKKLHNFKYTKSDEKKADLCYAYHLKVIRAYEVAIPKIRLKDWFGKKFRLIPVFRGICATTSNSNHNEKECEFLTIGKYILPFVDKKNPQSKHRTVKYFLLDTNTFKTTSITSYVLEVHRTTDDKYIMKFNQDYTQTNEVWYEIQIS